MLDCKSQNKRSKRCKNANYRVTEGAKSARYVLVIGVTLFQSCVLPFGDFIGVKCPDMSMALGMCPGPLIASRGPRTQFDGLNAAPRTRPRSYKILKSSFESKLAARLGPVNFFRRNCNCGLVFLGKLQDTASSNVLFSEAETSVWFQV